MTQKEKEIKKEVKKEIQKAVKETAKETAERMIKYGEMSLEKIALFVPSLSTDELKQIAAGITQ